MAKPVVKQGRKATGLSVKKAGLQMQELIKTGLPF